MLKSIRNAALAGLALATVAAPTAATAAPLSSWHGSYVWEESLGRVGGDRGDAVAIFRTYTLRLGPAAGATGCVLTGEGYQLYERIQCTATPEMSAVIIKYYPTRGARAYAPGQRLFTMTRTNRGIVTRLQALRPGSDATAPVGRLFRYAR